MKRIKKMDTFKTVSGFKDSTIYCLNCFKHLDSDIPKNYEIVNETLKSILQMDVLKLCEPCKKDAQATENFLSNIENNMQIIRKNANERCNSKYSLDDLVDTTKINDKELINSIDDKEDLDVSVKVEKLEAVCGSNDDFDHDYSEEPVTYKIDESLMAIKEENGNSLNIINVVHKSTLRKSKSFKKKTEIKSDKIKLGKKVIIIPVTRSQCLKDREKLLNSYKYINSRYKCKDCVKAFSFEDVYEKHTLKHSEAYGDEECDICKLRFKTKEKLMCHQRYHQARYKCTECEFVRVCRQTVLDHYMVAHRKQGVGHFPCQFCSKTFKCNSYRRKHVFYKHQNSKVAVCDYCQKTYVNKDVLKAHMMLKHHKEVLKSDKPPGKHVCTECGKAFNAPSSLKTHMIKHTAGRDYYCVECDKGFKTDLALKRHWKITSAHAEYTDLPYKCGSCEKRFGVNRDLERHMNRIHLNIKPFTCDHCDKAYVNDWSLREHKRFAHEGHKRPRKFPCNICDKVFDRNATRKAHIRTHTGERPYVCPKCPARFKQSGTLGTHMKLVHLKLTRDGRPKQNTINKPIETFKR